MSQIKLAGSKLNLRDWRLDDLPKYAEWLKPGQRWQELDSPYYPDPTPEQLPAIIERKQKSIEVETLPNPRSNLVIAASQQDELIGRVNWYWQSAETSWLSVGLVIYDSNLWGQGLGYEALGLWSEYLFREMPGLARLDLRTWSGNAGMMQLAQKLGYQEEARFRKARIVKGQYYDGMGYGILREEWEQRYAAGFAAQLITKP